jgi:hypothetical protein
MGSSAQHFFYVVVIAERIEQRVRADRISEPTEKKRVYWKEERC